MPRPRFQVDEHAIREGLAQGRTLSDLARDHQVSRDIIRRVGRESNVLAFPSPIADGVPADHLTTHALAERAGTSIRQIVHWTEFDFIEPIVVSSRLNGATRLYPPAEVAVACLMSVLIGDGVGVRTSHRLARELLATGSAVLAGIRIYLPEED